MTLDPVFQDRCRRSCAVRAESLNFASPDNALTINDWVSGSTDGNIKDLVSETDLAGATAVVMKWGHMMSSALVMRVDRPFFLGIWDDAAKTLLFAGVIRDLAYVNILQSPVIGEQ